MILIREMYSVAGSILRIKKKKKQKKKAKISVEICLLSYEQMKIFR